MNIYGVLDKQHLETWRKQDGERHNNNFEYIYFKLDILKFLLFKIRLQLFMNRSVFVYFRCCYLR